MIKIQKLHFKQLAIQVFSKLAESESQVSFSNIERFGGYEYRHFCTIFKMKAAIYVHNILLKIKNNSYNFKPSDSRLQCTFENVLFIILFYWLKQYFYEHA
jgi:hypothetical protein